MSTVRFAVLNGRFSVDVAPGGFQNVFNPLIYVPAYIFAEFRWSAALGNVAGRYPRAKSGSNLLAFPGLLAQGRGFWTIGATLLIAASASHGRFPKSEPARRYSHLEFP